MQKGNASLGVHATEAALRAVHAPRILHLATHGFFLPETETSEDEFETSAFPSVTLQNPMQRSGIALAGAQQTLDAWRRGQAPPGSDDGIVTAEEVGELDLQGTWLVTLSACDTGVGEARSGEGVLGLRRGFIQAGAENLLMTLSPAQREATTQPGACHNSKQSGSGLFALFPGSEGLARRGNPRSLGADFFTPRFTP